jgi:hypothetical protein
LLDAAAARQWLQANGHALPPELALAQPEWQPDAEPGTRRARPTSKLALALAVLHDHPDWTNKRIAAAAECNPKYLSQSSKFKAARAAIKGIGREQFHRERRNRGSDMTAYPDDDSDG